FVIKTRAFSHLLEKRSLFLYMIKVIFPKKSNTHKTIILMKIVAVGRNYIEHANELNNPVPTIPVIFLKPDTALLKDNKDFYYPEFSKHIDYEIEVVLRICKE